MKLTINDLPIRWIKSENAIEKYNGYIGIIRFAVISLQENLAYRYAVHTSRDNGIIRDATTLSEAKSKCEEYAKQFIEDLQAEK